MVKNNEEMILDLRFSDFKSLDETLSERNKYRDIRKAIKRALDDEMELLINLHFSYIHTQADGDQDKVDQSCADCTDPLAPCPWWGIQEKTTTTLRPLPAFLTAPCMPAHQYWAGIRA